MVKYIITLKYDLDMIITTETNLTVLGDAITDSMNEYGFDKDNYLTFISNSEDVNQVNAVLALQDIVKKFPVLPVVLKEAKLLRVTDIDDLLQVVL